MSALDALCERVSIPQLTAPEVTEAQLEILLKAALRAADHGRLRPSRYILICGNDRARLGEIFLQGKNEKQDLSSAQQDKARSLLLRAPTVIAAICRTQTVSKVPDLEQHYATAAAIQNMLNAAWALGLGAIWRTGEMAYSQTVRQALSLKDNEHIIGFVYLGQPDCQVKDAPQLEVKEFFTKWQANT